MSVENRFFPPRQLFSLDELAEVAGADIVRGDGSVLISGVGPLVTAGVGAVTFFDNAKYLKHLADTQASACLCAKPFVDRVPDHVAVLETAEPYQGYAAVLAHVYPEAVRPLGMTGNSEMTVSDRASVDPTLVCEENVKIEPGSIVGAGVTIGRDSIICAATVVAANVSIGRECSIGSNATLQHAIIGDRVIIHPGCQIGQDGFAFVTGPGGYRKVPQVGRVIIQDDVEIGANSNIDRGANRDTFIGEGTKIDNQVQIGHDVEIGRHCLIDAQAAISGSSRLGDFVVIGGRTGVSRHVTIGDRAQIAGACSVHANVPARDGPADLPARPARD